MTILLQGVPKKIPFFWDTLYINEQNFEVDNCSVCKKDKQGSSIETLPSSFSHLYSSSLQEPGAGGDIPRCQQVSSCSCRVPGDQLRGAGGAAGHVRRGGGALPHQQEGRHDGGGADLGRRDKSRHAALLPQKLIWLLIFWMSIIYISHRWQILLCMV